MPNFLGPKAQMQLNALSCGVDYAARMHTDKDASYSVLINLIKAGPGGMGKEHLLRGGEFCFPELGLALDLPPFHWILFDPWLMHGAAETYGGEGAGGALRCMSALYTPMRFVSGVAVANSRKRKAGGVSK